jgi:hypothetical protein
MQARTSARGRDTGQLSRPSLGARMGPNPSHTDSADRDCPPIKNTRAPAARVMTELFPPLLPLEQRRGSALPALSFFLGYGLHVVDVGAGLRQYVVQVIAYADECKAFFQEFAYPRGAEQEDSEYHVILACVFDERLGGASQFRGRVHERKFILFVESHGHAQVILSEEEDVDARNGRDLGDVVDAGSRFHL